MGVDLEDYRNWLAGSGLSRCTIHQRVLFAQRRITAWGSLDQPPHVVADWLAQYGGWTRRTYHNHLRSVYAWMIETGQLSISPLTRVRRTQAPAPRPTPLSPAELQLALDTADDERLRTWLLLGALAGLRAFEIAAVHGSDVTKTSIFVRGKGGKDALVPTHPLLWEAAQSYPTDRYWFPSPQRSHAHISESLVSLRVREHFRALGISPGSAHRLRHTFGTSLSAAGVQPRVIQELMRHSSLDTTMRYLAVSNDEKVAAVRALTWTSRQGLRPTG